MYGATWTGKEEEKLIALALAGKTPQDIATALDRSVAAVVIRLTSVADDRARWARAIKILKESECPPQS